MTKNFYFYFYKQIDRGEPIETEASFYNNIMFYNIAINFFQKGCSSSVGAYLGNVLLLDRKHLLKPKFDMGCILFNKFKLDRENSQVKNIIGGPQASEISELIGGGFDDKKIHVITLFLLRHIFWR